MKKKILITLLALSLCGASALAAAKTMPLLALWKARAGHEHTIWMEQRAKIGDESVVGYIQATGGGDDAMMGFIFEENWDLLSTTIGFKKGTPKGREAEFSVEVDGEVVYKSGTMSSDGPAQNIRIPLLGKKRLLLRVTSDDYNGTAGACWGQPTLYSGLSPEEMKSDWTLQINDRKTVLPGSNAPSEVKLPFDVPLEGEAEYTVKVRRDNKDQTVIVEKVKVGL